MIPQQGCNQRSGTRTLSSRMIVMIVHLTLGYLRYPSALNKQEKYSVGKIVLSYEVTVGGHMLLRAVLVLLDTVGIPGIFG